MLHEAELYKHNYEGFERVDNFASEQALRRYRASLLSKSREEADFIGRHVGRRGLRVLELCCGNGRLLMALAERGALAYGLGVEISADRVRFAQRWIADSMERRVHCIEADALYLESKDWEPFDLVVCISGAFGYFKVVDARAPERVLAAVHRLLKPGGQLLLELFQLTDDFRQMLHWHDGPARTWRALQADDPFAFQLDEFEYSEETRILRRSKVFIRRDGLIDARRAELVADHSVEEIDQLGSAQGFCARATYADFEDTPFVAGTSSRLVRLAQKWAGPSGFVA